MRICKKRYFIAVLLSLTLAASGRASPKPQGGYAVLALDEAQPERAVVEALAAEGFTGVIGESTQWVFLDEFGELARIPLDAFSRRLEAFDPRNDGYVQRLRSFFVHDGKRRLYLPQKADLEARLAAALGDTPFSIVEAEESGLITAAEYKAHAAFQAGFSYRSMSGQGEYLRYYLGEDGLIREETVLTPYDEDGPGVLEIPPFPLEDLMTFLARTALEREAAFHVS